MSQFAPEDSQGSIDLVSNGDITFEADRDQDGAGDLVFRTGGVERARIKHDGSGTGWPNVLGGAVSYAPAPSGDTTGATDRAAIQALLNSGVKRLDFSAGAGDTYYLDQSLVINNTMTCHFYSESPFEQKSWGVPVFEVRADDVQFLGDLVCAYTGSRTSFDATALSASNNSALVKTECAGDPKDSGSAVYCRTTYDRFYAQRIRAKGFISGLFLGLYTARDWRVDSISVDTVDFGVLGLVGIDGAIGTIQAHSITRTQGVDEHAIYCVTNPNRSRGLYIGAILVDGIQTNVAHAASIKSVDDFRIDMLAGTNCGTLLNTIDSKGSVGFICGRSLSLLADTDGGVIVQCQSSSIIQIDGADIEANAAGSSSSAYSHVFDSVTSSELTVVSPRVHMTGATPGVAFRASALAWYMNPRIVYDNAPASGLGAFMIAGTKSATVCQYIIRPHLRGTDQLIRAESSGDAYEAEIDPNWINGGAVSDSSVVSGTTTYHTRVIAELEGAITLSVNSATPRVRCPVTNFVTANTVATTITQFGTATQGQKFSVRCGDAHTTIQNNATIHTATGADVLMTSGQVMWFQVLTGSLVAYEIAATA